MPSMLFSLVFTSVFTSSQCEIFDQSSTMLSNPMLHFVWHVQQHCGQNVYIRELHGDGDDGNRGNTAVMELDVMTDTAVIAGMGTAFTVVPR